MMNKIQNKISKRMRVAIFRRKNNLLANKWEKKILDLFNKSRKAIELDSKNPEAIVILGGDGTILEAVRIFNHLNPLFLGLNLGHVGFLSSVRDEKEFPKALKNFIQDRYAVTERMVIEANVIRNNKVIHKLTALNDLSVQNLLGMVKLSVLIDGHPLQYIHGSGALIATATGSTAYNLSAHGPIVMPDIRCYIVTELLDHNIPTPPIVVKHNRTIEIVVKSFRKRDPILLQKDGTPVDVVLSADGASIFSLQEKDIVKITEALRPARFVEFEDNYFFKSLEEKFAFR